MALQIRRGTNKERLQITPAEGELIYVTDYELVTISASANVSTNVLTSVAHGLITNQQIRFQDTTKNGLTLNQVYYVASTPDPDTFTLKTTLGGSTLDITGTYTVPLVFSKTPTDAAGAPLGINVTALWIGDGDTIGGVPGNTQGLDDLADVVITTPAEGNTLYYDATTKQWKNTNILAIDDVTGTQNIYVNGTGVSTIKATNTYTNLGFGVLDLFSRTTATPVNGFGSAITFTANNAAGTDKLLGYTKFGFSDIVAPNEDANFSISLLENGVSPAYPDPGTVVAQLRLDSVGNLAVRGDLTVNSDTGNNQSAITFNHPTANGSITWQGTGHFLSGDLVVNGGTDNLVIIDAAANTGIANIFNGAIGTINMGNGVVTELNLGNAAAGSRLHIKSPQTDIDGALTVTGNLTVNGTTTTVNSATMTVDDPNLVLNAVGSPTDANANLGGITVKGATDKLLYWNNADKRWYFNNGTGGSVDGDRKMVVDLTDIQNVETTAFNKGQMFFYDGTNWVNGSNIKFNNAEYRPNITTQVNLDTNNNPNSGGVNTALRLVKDSTSAAYTDGAGTGLIMSVVSDSQPNRIDVGRLQAAYDVGGAHDISLITTTTDNNTFLDLIRTSKDRTTINNGILYVNATNSRVGINTVSPNTTLDVAGNAYIQSTLGVASTISAGSNIFGGGELYLAGTTVVLKNGFTGAPNSEAGFLVERGNEPDAYWKWFESTDAWTSSNNIFSTGEIVANGIMGTNTRQMILNNGDATPAGTDHATLRVKRGSGSDVFLRWNETSNRWDFTNDGTTYTNIPVATDTPTYAGLNTTSGNINVNNSKTILYSGGDIKAGGDIYADGNNLTFNYAETGTPTTGTAGLIVERGTLANTQLRWNNSNLRWESTVDGSAYIALPNQSLDQGSSPTFSSLTANGFLVVNGSVDLGTGGEDTITMNGLVANNITFSFNDSATPRGILGQMSTGANDYWFVGGAESGGTSNAGELLLATGDDGNDPIRVRQYTGNPLVSTTYRQLTLLDGSGNTLLPGNTLTLRASDTGTPNSANTTSIVVERGDPTNAALTFYETDDTWYFTNNAKIESNFQVIGNTILSGTTLATGDLTLGSGNIGSTAGVLQLTSPATHHIKLTPGTTGNVYLESSTVGFGDTAGTLGATLTTNGAGDLRLDTNNGSNSGFIHISNGVNGNLTLDPNGTGEVIVNSNVDVNGNLNAVDTTFSSIILDGRSGFDTESATTTAITPVYLGETGRKAMKVFITASTATDTQVLEAVIMRDANDANGAQIALYGELRTGASLATYTADYDSVNSQIRLVITPASTTSTIFNIVRTSLN